MDAGVISALVIAAGSVLVAVVTTRQNRQGQKATEKLNERVVNREDFEKVMDRMDKDLVRYEKRVGDLENRLDDEVKERMKADDRASEAEKRAERVEKHAERLEKRVRQLVAVLEEHDIPVPPMPD